MMKKVNPLFIAMNTEKELTGKDGLVGKGILLHKHNDLNQISRTQTEDGELQKVVLWPWHVYHGIAHLHI